MGVDDGELLNWIQVGPDGTVKIIVGDEKRGQLEFVIKVALQNVILVGHDPATGYPQLSIQAGNFVRITRCDPGWRAPKKKPDKGYA